MPAPTYIQVGSSTDSVQITVNDLIKSPSMVPRRILDMSDQMFIADQLLRPGPSVPSGWVQFYQSNPLFADRAAEIIRERGEIPIAIGSVGQLSLAHADKRGLAVIISKEMQDENRIDLVNLQIQQVANTMVQTWDSVFFNALVSNPNINSLAAASGWAASANPMLDIMKAAQLIIDQKRGFRPNTLVLSTTDLVNLTTNPNAWKAFVGNVANLAPGVTGKLPQPLFGFLEVWTTYSLTPGTALMMERGTCGFISDERALQATPLYWKPENETWRSDTIRKSAVGIDQPLCVCKITSI